MPDSQPASSPANWASTQAATGPAEVAIIARDLKFPEGPVFDPDDHLYVCDMGAKPNPRIARISPDGTVDTFADTGGCPNGAIRGKDGRLWVCDNRQRALVAVGLSGENETKTEIICRDAGGERFRGPNDLVMDGAGNVYFTDPVGSSAKNPIGCVYRWDAGTKKAVRIAEKMAFPNGIALSDDQKTLYVAETQARVIWAYPLGADGGLGERRKAADLQEGHGPDGIALDAKGRLLAAWFGASCIAVFDPATGELLKKVPLPEEQPSNLEFGGTEHDMLYVTGFKLGAVLRLKWDCAGQKQVGDVRAK